MSESEPRTLLSAQRLVVESFAPGLAAPGSRTRTDRPILAISARPGTGLGTALTRTVAAFTKSPVARLKLDADRSEDTDGPDPADGLPGVLSLLAMAVGRLRAHRGARRSGLRFTAFDVCFEVMRRAVDEADALDFAVPKPKAAVNRFLRGIYFLKLRRVEDRIRGIGQIQALPAWIALPLAIMDIPLRLAFLPGYLMWRRRLDRVLCDCRSLTENDLTTRIIELWSVVGERDAPTIDRIQCEVLLSDLTDQHDAAAPAPLLLIDNVDFSNTMSLGTRVLKGLAKAHALHVDGAGWGPLAVIAAGSGAAETITVTSETTIDDILLQWNHDTIEAGDQGNADKWIIHLAYPGLRPDDVRRLCRTAHSGFVDADMADWVLQFAQDQVVDAQDLVNVLTQKQETRAAVAGDPDAVQQLLTKFDEHRTVLKNRIVAQPTTADRPAPLMKAGHRHPDVDRTGRYLPSRTPRQRRRSVARTALVTVLTAALGLFVTPYAAAYFSSCEGDPLVQRVDDECVGVTDGSFSFDDELDHVSRLIREENDRIETETDAARIVTIAYLAPVTDPSVESMRHQLEGAHLAQIEANHGSVNPRRTAIRLLIANTGNGGLQWASVVDDLVSRKNSEPDNLIAVAGLGSSYRPTFAAMRELSSNGIPMIGSVTTADGVLDEIGTAYRVAPDNTDEARALVDYLHSDADVSTAMLIQDTNPADRYAATLSEAFAELFPVGGREIVASQVYDSSKEGFVESFANMVRNICSVKPDIVFFAGRGAKGLPDLVTELVGRNCLKERLRIVTGDDASHFPDRPKIRETVEDANVSIEYAGLAHPGQWESDVDTGSLPEDDRARDAFEMERFVDDYLEMFGDTEDLLDGQSIMSYDAVTLTIDAIRLFDMDEPTAESLSNALPQLVGCYAVNGLTGRLAVTADGDIDNKAIPILAFDHKGPPRVISVAWPNGAPTPIPDDC